MLGDGGHRLTIVNQPLGCQAASHAAETVILASIRPSPHHIATIRNPKSF
jgi:hypothetical protein